MNKTLRNLLALFLLLALFSGAVWAQISSEHSFELVMEIGRPSPQVIKYDPNFDRFVWTDNDGRLLLVDASTYEVQHVLYESGVYSGYQFSHDGRWLALAIEQRVEVWETENGMLVQSFSPDSAQGITSLLQFSDDDTLLMLTAIVPAPDSIRRSETDTSQTPWLWELAAERGERRSILPLQRIQQPFYDLRNGLLLTPENRLFAAYSGLMQLMDIGDDSYAVLSNISTQRYERDPIDVWYGLDNQHIYFRPQNSYMLQQIRTDNYDVIDIPTGNPNGARALASFDDLALTNFSQIVGESSTTETYSLLTLLLGADYHSQFNNHPITVMIIDVLNPVTVTQNQMGLLVYIFDETAGRGTFEFVRPVDIVNMAVSPDRRHLVVRRASGQQPLEIYNMATGSLELSIIPTIPDFNGDQILTYNATGDQIISGFQRFDALTGEVLLEDLTYQGNFEQWFFTDDSRHLVTLTGSLWQEWDLDTNQVIRRETVNLRGILLEVTNNAQRFLTVSEDGYTYELVDVGTEERLSVTFDYLQEAALEQVIYSDDWQNYLVVYGSDSYSQHAPGNRVALYNIHDGLRWFVAGDDLPVLDSRVYGWLDNDTAYVMAATGGVDQQPERIYGLDYDASGLPSCLVETFPDTWTQWSDLWEQLTYRMRSDSLGRLTERLCAANATTVEEVDAVFFPSATPTRPPVTATPAVVAGVPACLTQSFPGSAREYADDWRAMIEGLPPEQVAEVERLLCEGLGEARSVGNVQEVYIETYYQEVMLIDMETGVRSLGSFLPAVPRVDRPLQPVFEEFRLSEGLLPDYGVLSPDNNLFAVRGFHNNIAIYRLVRPYSSLMDDLTATASVILTNQPNAVALAPTATAPFVELGAPRPTLTPTITPTSPPPPQATVTQSAYQQVEELCSLPTIYSIHQPPTDFAPTGRLYATRGGDSALWVYPVTDGGGYRDVTIPVNGQYSPDHRWMLLYGNTIVVARADGTDAVTLYESFEQPVFPQSIYWLDNDTLEYVYEGYLPDVSMNPITLMRRYDVETGVLSEPFLPPRSITINTLPVQIVSTQPQGGSLAVVSMAFNTGLGEGYRYFLYDRATGETQYLARQDSNLVGISFEWNPTGGFMYYTLPYENDWYVYDVAAREHRILGELPGGVWSRDGRWRATYYYPSNEEYDARVEAEQPIPNLSIWDSATGLTRRYCIPDVYGMDGIGYYWSPDSRYLAFTTYLVSVANIEAPRPRTLLLDTQTGSVTELTYEIDQIVLWSE
jgi:hypothetical protein